MSQLFNEFYYQVFNTYIVLDCECLEQKDLKYTFKYNTDKTITEYYTNDDKAQLICKQYHYGYEDYEYEFTIFAFNYYKQLILEYDCFKLNEYFNKQFNNY